MKKLLFIIALLFAGVAGANATTVRGGEFTSTTASYGLFTTHQASSVAADSLVGYWTMDDEDVSGATVNDVSGNSLNGTKDGTGGDNNLPQSITGTIGDGLDFDGTDDVVNVSDNDALDLTTAFTISYWIKEDGDTWQTVWGTPIAKRHTSDLVMNYGCNVNGAGGTDKLQCYFYDGGFKLVDFPVSDMSTNTWHHVVYTAEDTGDVATKLYLNGVLKDTGNFSGKNLLADDNDLEIGHFDHTTTDEELDAQLDDVRIYSRALEPWEILTMYNSSI